MPRRHMSHSAPRYSIICDRRVTRPVVPLSRRPGVPNFRIFCLGPPLGIMGMLIVQNEAYTDTCIPLLSFVNGLAAIDFCR